MTRPQLLLHDFGQEVLAFSTTRHGGCSRGNYGEFNINCYCGDSPEATEANRSLLCRELGIGTECLVMPHQTHHTETRKIGADFPTLTPAHRQQALEGVDAVMTDVPGICVGVSTADCIPVLLYDNKRHACCAVHAGWRGTAERIAAKAVAAMTAAYGTDPASLQACIGPGISLENFEVGDEVYRKFADAGFRMECVSRKYEKWHIDLWKCNRDTLAEAGVNPRNIRITGLCTYSNTDEFFSARRLGTASGRIFTGIIIKQTEQLKTLKAK